MIAWFYTNKGPSRSESQDGVYINGSSFTDMLEPAMLEISASEGLFAVVDGMGGMGGGETARDIVLEHLPELTNSNNFEKDLAGISAILRQKAQGHAELAHMGVTIAGIWIDGDKAIAFNCGDCRVYQIRSGYLQKLTHDHSLVQELVDQGVWAEEEMRFHPRKNIVTSALDVEDQDPHVFEKTLRLQSGSAFLVCSDGLWEALGQEEMESQLVLEPGEAAAGLVAKALEAPASDNFSFILLFCGA